MESPASASGLKIQISRSLSKHVYNSPRRRDFFTKFISVRSVFVVVSFAIVISMAVGLITLSYEGQLNIATDLSKSIVQQMRTIVIGEMRDLYSWADEQLYLSTFLFSNFTLPPRDSGLVEDWYSCLEPLWTIARAKSTGVNVEIIMSDNRSFGFDNLGIMQDLYRLIWKNASDPDSSLVLDWWDLNTTTPINTVDLIPNDFWWDVPPPYPIYDYLRNSSRDYLMTCDSPHYWIDAYYYWLEGYTWILVTAAGTLCNKHGEMLGIMQVSIGISSINSVLEALAAQYKGKIFIMDENAQLIASSTNTPIFGEAVDIVGGLSMVAPRITAKNTNETWIRDVFAKLDSYEDQSRIVTINGTKYMLAVTNWNEFPNIDYIIVKLLEYDQFVGSTLSIIRNSIYATVGIATGAVLFVLLVSYWVTQPLFVLASNMQKMSRLDLDVDPTDRDPLLFEMKNLHHSFVGMNAALKSFKKFVPVQIISRIIQSKKEVAAELRFCNLTVMFQDIAGFTSLSESMDPTQLAKLTSEYMGVMTTIICKHGGTIDKYVGDCIMSLFNAPEEMPNHQEAATAAAVECLLVLIEKNKEWKARYGVEMAFRTGINSGEALVGNMGSDNRINYTAFGDSVNIAARLEGVNKVFGTHIIISKIVWEVLPKDKYITRKLGKVRVSGKETPTTVYEVVGETNATMQQLFGLYAESLEAFRNKEFAKANLLIDHALSFDPTDKPSLHLKSRITEALSQPDLVNSDSWTHVENLVKF